MGSDEITDQSLAEKSSASSPVPQTSLGKFLYGLFIFVMPILAFWATDLFKPEWQTGKLSDYLILFLFPEASLPFIVLLTYSVLCYWLLLIDADRYSQMYIVRLGIYTGVLLGFQYTVISALYFYDNSNNVWTILFVIVLWGLPVIIPKIYRWLVKKWRADRVHASFLGLILLLFLISAVLTKNPLYPFVFILVGLTIAAPFWCFLLMLRAAVWSLRRYGTRVTLAQGLGLGAWMAGYVAAWRLDILKMYELYAALPPEPPPDCYIATAAARGHPWLVGSWLIEHPSGKTLRVNQQLQVLKCTELAILAVQPRLHKRLRRIYDVVGRSLAQWIGNPVLADLAYLLLKPLDLLSWWILGALIPEIDVISKKMYSN